MTEQLHDAHVAEHRRQQKPERLHDGHVAAWRAWLAEQDEENSDPGAPGIGSERSPCSSAACALGRAPKRLAAGDSRGNASRPRKDVAGR